MVEARVIADVAGAVGLTEAWDRLAVAAGQPMSSPAWMLAWVRHLAPRDGQLAIVAVEDAGETIGIVPLLDRTQGGCTVLRTLAAEHGRCAPLAVRGREWEVAVAALRALDEGPWRPDVVQFANAPMGAWHAAWQAAIRVAWGRWRGAVAWADRIRACPNIRLGVTYDEWIAGKSANFRSEMRRARRRFERAGGRLRLADAETLEADVEAYLRLHLSRRGAASDLHDIAGGMRAALVEAGRQLAPKRMRLHMLEIDGEPIGALLCMAAGGEVLFSNVGWSERHARLKPGIVGLLAAVEEACARGDARIDLGPGTYPYKLRFASGDDPVFTATFARPSARLMRAGIQHGAPRALARLRRGGRT